MAAATQDKQDQEQDKQDARKGGIPTEFPVDQLFIAVSDRGGEVAGEDGGPRTGGKGMWLVGEVARWTSGNAVPLALRDPNTGIIWKGYLEPVLRQFLGQDGKMRTESHQFFVQNPAAPVRTAKKAPGKTSAPSEAAQKRAANGPGKLAPLVRPEGAQNRNRAAAERSGLVVER